MKIDIKYYSLPDCAHGITQQMGKNDYLIIINENLSQEQAEHTFKHEMLHIKLNHFNRNLIARECEREVAEILRHPKKVERILGY